MILWLEDIVHKSTACSWSVNGEGPVVTLEFILSSERTGELRISDNYSDKNLTVSISASQLVMTVYRSFHTFVNSPAYEPYEWESLSLGEYLQEQLGWSAEELHERLALYPAKALGQLSWHITPVYDFLGPGGRMEPEWQREDINDPIDAIANGRCVAVMTLPSLPVTYDTAKIEERKKMLRRFLKRSVKGFAGEKLRELSSSVIEEWLSS